MYETPAAQLALLPTCRHTMVDVPILMVGSLSLRLTHPPHPEADGPSDEEGEATGDDVVAAVDATGADVVACPCATRWPAFTSTSTAIKRRDIGIERILVILFIGGI